MEARPTHASASTGSRFQRRDLGQCQVTDWLGVPSYSRAASGTAWSADGREAYPSPYEGTANDVITAGLFRWNAADRRAFHFPAPPEQCGAIR